MKLVLKKKLELYVHTKTFQKLGTIQVLADQKSIYAVCFDGELDSVLKRLNKTYKVVFAAGENKISRECFKQIEKYLSKKITSFDLPLKLVGTEFQKKIWQQLLKIPYGQISTYKQIGHALKMKSGFQSVGQANKSNPICIIIPCHRVISSSGQLSGYIGGSQIKKSLLKLESLT